MQKMQKESVFANISLLRWPVESQKYIRLELLSNGLFCLGNGCLTVSHIHFCDVLNMPPPSQPSYCNEHPQALYEAHKEVVEEKLAKAREHVHELYQKENPNLTEDDALEHVNFFYTIVLLAFRIETPLLLLRTVIVAFSTFLTL